MKNFSSIFIGSSIILSISIFGYFYRDTELKKAEILSKQNYTEMKEETTNNSQTQPINNEAEENLPQKNTSMKLDKSIECAQVYTFLKNKYNNILSVTYSEQLNDCLISLPDETGKPIYIKLSESNFNQ